MLDCPHCHKTAMTQFQKAFLGPARTVPCAVCGMQVSVSWLALLGFAPFFAGIFFAVFLFPDNWYFLAFFLFLGIVLTLAIHSRFIPLAKRSG